MKLSSIIAIACLLSISVEETMAIRLGNKDESLKKPSMGNSKKPKGSKNEEVEEVEEKKSKSEKKATKEGDDDVKGDIRPELEQKKKDLKEQLEEKKNP